MLLCRSDADGHAESLAERAGGDFDARGFAVLRVTGRVRAPLAELLELRHRQVVAGEMQRAVEQRGGVAVGQDEAVAVDPLGVGGIVLHELVVEQVGDGGAAERRAGVTGVGFLNGVDGEKSEGVDGELVEFVFLGILLVAHSFPLLDEETRRRRGDAESRSWVSLNQLRISSGSSMVSL